MVGTNEEYDADKDGGLNAGAINATSLAAIGQAGVLSYANSRVYAFNADGGLISGWPAKVGIINAELLPDVGEGITGSPVLAKLTCPSGGAGVKVGVIPDAGPGYVFNADGSSCYGQSDGHDNALATDVSAGAGQVDHPVFPAVGLPAFGDLGGLQPTFVAPVAGLLRALDLVVPDYQVGGQDFTAAWDASTGQMRPGFPAQENDLAFLTGPSVGDIDGVPGRGDRRGHGVARSAGVQRARPAGEQRVAEADRRLDGGDAAAGFVRRRHAQDGCQPDAARRRVRLRHSGPGLLALVVTALPPRRGELGRLRPRCGAAGQAG